MTGGQRLGFSGADGNSGVMGIGDEGVLSPPHPITGLRVSGPCKRWNWWYYSFKPRSNDD